jgi:hypothetical protein
MDTWSNGKNKAKTKPMQNSFIEASPLPKPEQTKLQNVERLLAFEPVILIIDGLE